MRGFAAFRNRLFWRSDTIDQQHLTEQQILTLLFSRCFTSCTPYHHEVSSITQQPKKSPKSDATRRKTTTSHSPVTPHLPSHFPSYHPSNFYFEILHKSTKSNARVGRIHTPHGVVDTPGFVAVATNAALKAVDFHSVDNLNDEESPLQLVFCNTYHLMLHPGVDTICSAGGLHKFAGRRRDRPFITDSGGFQVFSLAYGTVHEELHSLKRASQSKRTYDVHIPFPPAVESPCTTKTTINTKNKSLVVRIDDSGVEFKSYRDGTRLFLTPQSSIQAQKKLGADIILPLDELPPYHITDGDLRRSVERTHRWEARSLLTHIEDPRDQAIYGIIHGGSLPDLRRHSAEFITSLPFDGYAIGGALGQDREELRAIVRGTMQYVPQNKPCHVLGIADPISIPDLIQYGCDTFDSAYATRVGRHGAMLTTTTMALSESRMMHNSSSGGDSHGIAESIISGSGNNKVAGTSALLRVGAGAYKSAHRPPVEGCGCPTCKNNTLSYLHHLVKAKEPLAATLLSMHNLCFMSRMMSQLRRKIYENEI